MRARPFYGAVFTVSAATLVLQVVTTRLLSVLTWYHLAFLAISLSMLGLTAGAVWTYLRADAFARHPLSSVLGRHSAIAGLLAAGSHVVVLNLPVPTELGANPKAIVALLAVITFLTLPFVSAGVVLALALTRTNLRIGGVYAADLLGAASGCLGAVLLLESFDPSTCVLLVSAGLVAAGVLFARSAEVGGHRRWLAGLALSLVAVAVLNVAIYPRGLSVQTMKGKPVPGDLAIDRWNSHSRITGRAPQWGPPALWSEDARARVTERVLQVPLRIDGGAFTVATGFDGNRSSLSWLESDLTSVAHRLRGAGAVGVIGVGGGRDLLTAVHFGAKRIVGVEINEVFLDLLEGELRGLTRLADRSEIELVHAEGRSYFARPGESFDLLQMALVDTWASTTAGAMTLTENGLYTVEAWRIFLRRLKPDGVLTVSRWYAPDKPGETARLVSLAMATLIEEGVAEPRRHLALAGVDNLSTLILSRTPLADPELSALRQTAGVHGFRFLVLPGERSTEPLLERLVGARTRAELEKAATDSALDYSPPTDDRPFFFNMLRPASWWRANSTALKGTGVLAGNLQATETLVSIFGLVLLLALLTVVLPLLLLGKRHGLPPGRFAAAATYFSLIGLGFMLAEIALMQRFSSLLGHPMLSLVVTLMSLILATGVGSYFSDRLELRTRTAAALIPVAMAAVVVAVAQLVGPLARWATPADLPARIAVVLALTVPLGLALGLAFPIGLRLLRRRSDAALSWMWGLNGAFGVVGSVLAAGLAIAYGISHCLALAAACYLALSVPAALLWRDRIETR